ncbi:MAG: FAD-dependent monooxygenase [Chromatiales bacterium]
MFKAALKQSPVSRTVLASACQWRAIPTRCKFIVFIPQWDFLSFVAQQAAHYPGFDLRMRAEATDLIEESGRVAGLRAQTPNGLLEIRAELIVAADGLGSILREKAGLVVHDLGAHRSKTHGINFREVDHMTTIIGLFDSVGEAEKAARDLMSTGFSHEDIGLIASDATGEWSRYKVSTLEGAGPSSKALGTKMGAGTALGGLGGLVIGELAIPGIGWVAAAGTVAATLLGAGLGAIAGGFASVIDTLGVPKDRSGRFVEAMRRGGTLVSVRVAEDRENEAAEIMQRHQAVDIDKRAAEWKAAGWRE